MHDQDRRLKLLIMTDTAILGAGGSERFLRNLLRRLPSDRYAIDVLQLSPPLAEDERIDELVLPSVRFLHRPIGASYGLRGFATLHFVQRCVRRRDYDIVQSQHEKSDLINALLPRTRGLSKISNRRDMGFQKSARVRSLFRKLNHRFDRVIAPSTNILRALVAEENVVLENCRTIANGVDTERFHPAAPQRRAALRSALGVPTQAPLIGCVASFSPVKRHVDLIAAFAEVRHRHPEAQLLLVGDGSLRVQIQAQIAALDLGSSVRLLGARADVEAILPVLDVFVLASSTEGMSNAILEAQACGVAVVATAVGGNPGMIEDGKTGLLVPACTPPALAAALEEILDDPQRLAALGCAARARVERDYSLEGMAAAYDHLYHELARAH